MELIAMYIILCLCPCLFLKVWQQVAWVPWPAMTCKPMTIDSLQKYMWNIVQPFCASRLFEVEKNMVNRQMVMSLLSPNTGAFLCLALWFRGSRLWCRTWRRSIIGRYQGPYHVMCVCQKNPRDFVIHMFTYIWFRLVITIVSRSPVPNIDVKQYFVFFGCHYVSLHTPSIHQLRYHNPTCQYQLGCMKLRRVALQHAPRQLWPSPRALPSSWRSVPSAASSWGRCWNLGKKGK